MVATILSDETNSPGTRRTSARIANNKHKSDLEKTLLPGGVFQSYLDCALTTAEMSLIRHAAANLLGEEDTFPRLHGRAVAHEAGRKQRTPVRARQSAGLPTAALEKARMATQKAAS